MQVDDRLNGDGTGLPFGVNDGILGWVIVGVLGTIWAIYFTSQKDLVSGNGWQRSQSRLQQPMQGTGVQVPNEPAVPKCDSSHCQTWEHGCMFWGNLGFHMYSTPSPQIFC